MTGRRHARPLARPAGNRGMTLIELILVMALMVTVLAITTPQLSGFFQGRRAREEARRFLALTRFARSEAVARCQPMELWIDPEARAYGLRPVLAVMQEQDRERSYTLADGLTMEVKAQQINDQSQATIGFDPDGSLSENSATAVRILEPSREGLLVARTGVGEGYEILEEAPQ